MKILLTKIKFKNIFNIFFNKFEYYFQFILYFFHLLKNLNYKNYIF